jgi:hypothetical protein
MRDDGLPWIAALFVVVAVGVILILAWKQSADYETACRSKGGVVVGGHRSPRHCIRAQDLIDVD